MINKKGSVLDTTSENIFWLPRILFMIVFIIVVTTPISCFSQEKLELLKSLEEETVDLTFFELKNCIEKEGLNEAKLNSCFTKQNIAALIEVDEDSFYINKNKYEKELCISASNTITCPSQESFLKINDEIKKVKIGLVLHNG